MPPGLPHAWATAIRTVLNTATRILVLGPADSGKSTLCRLLLEQARGADRSAAILDLDLGQKLIGPPACVTLGTVTRQGPVLRGLAFAGTTDPVAGGSLLLAGAARLAACAAADLHVVNTCGYLGGRGLALKRAAIAATAADTLLILGQDPAGAALRSFATGRTVLCLPVASQARRKTPGERRAARRAAFATYFADSRLVHLPDGPAISSPSSSVLSPGRLVGLADSDGTERAIGVLDCADNTRGGIWLRTPPPPFAVGEIRPGALVLDAAFDARPVADGSGRPQQRLDAVGDELDRERGQQHAEKPR